MIKISSRNCPDSSCCFIGSACGVGRPKAPWAVPSIPEIHRVGVQDPDRLLVEDLAGGREEVVGRFGAVVVDVSINALALSMTKRPSSVRV